MNRFLLFLCFLCIPWAARGQAAYDWLYWFDDDDAHRHTGVSQGESFRIDTEVGELSEGFHTLHVQVADTAGRFSPPHATLFYHIPDKTITALYYWFDNDVEHVYESASTGGHYTIDVKMLEPGLHYVYCQAKDAKGVMTDVSRAVFYRQMLNNALKWTYWFDEDGQTTTVENPGEAVLIDVSHLDDGFHTIHSQVSETSVSEVVSRMFIKVPQTEGVADMTCICMVDGRLVAQEKVPAAGGIMHWQMNVDSIDVGVHRASFQVITPSGVASNIADCFFLRAITDKEIGTMKCVYSLDNFHTQSQAGTMSNGLFHFGLDVSALEDGLHRIAYMLISEQGITTSQKTAYFWKAPLGGDGIVQYDYWLNNDEEHTHKVKLDKRENPFKLVSLLPVETQPIRSSCFHFEVKAGQPMIYAKNDFHIRFYDTSTREVSQTKQFVDYQVGQEVTDVTLLNPSEHKTSARPADNEVKWYKVEAETGDSLQFRLDCAATIQLFAPSGEEVYKSSGSESLKWGGFHAEENGIFYVALHDVTATRGTTISIDYEHIDKYAVLHQDVDVVGNGGCSTITFDGNGFQDLYAVDLCNAKGDTIKHVFIGHESNAKTTVTFDFTDAEPDSYDALFRFAGGELKKVNNITVEEAKDIELALDVTFPSSFPHGLSTTYTVKITNSGNMTAYTVPIYTWIMNKQKKNGIYHIKYDGLDLPGIFDGVDTDSLSANDRAELQTMAESIGDGHYFMLFRAEDEDSPGDSVWVRSNYFFTNIAPYETKTLRLTISADEGVWAYFTVPEDWPSYQIAQVEGVAGARAKFRAPSMKDRYCCIRNKVECVANLVADGTSIANEILQYAPDLTTQMAAAAADCVASGASKIISTAGTVMCDDNSVEKNFWDKVHAALDGTSTTGMITSCISKLPLPWKKIKAILDAIGKGAGGASMAFGLGVDMADCAIAFTSKIPGCPPIPPDGGGSDGGGSWDPNDIYGYLSESGSKFMTDSVKTMNYTIEFENDTTFATAAAYKVVIRDTLDSRYFDMSSYAPTMIQIGDKVVHLNGEQNFITTVDMRPSINAIAQVEGKFEASKGIATWMFTSLDPMSMEPATDIMQGFLPLNYDGKSGIGEVSFNIQKRAGLKHQTEIPNRASIVFDVNEPIMTPTWTNIIDRIAPESRVSDVLMLNDSTASVSIQANDELSGVWRYDVYVQYGAGSAWWKAAENVPADTTATVKIYEGMDHGFYVLATDSAGNVERKQAMRELTLNLSSTVRGDVNGDGQVGIADIVAVTGYMAGTNSNVSLAAADVNGDGQVGIADIVAITDIMAGTANMTSRQNARYKTYFVKRKE